MTLFCMCDFPLNAKWAGMFPAVTFHCSFPSGEKQYKIPETT